MRGRGRWGVLALVGAACVACSTDVGFFVPPGRREGVERTAVVATIAQTFELLHSFTEADGSAPQATLVAMPNGFLYGIATGTSERDRGTVFRLSTSPNETAPTVEILFDFSSAAAFAPASLAVLPDGTLAGVTQAGGNSNGGMLFRLSAGGALVDWHHFAGGDGVNPRHVVADAEAVYGVTEVGGPQGGRGTLFSFAGDRLSVLHSFAAADGTNPVGLVQGRDGSLYGTTRAGGSNGRGTIFRFDRNSGLTVLHDFAGTDGATPAAGLTVAADGTLYGTTARGGSADSGVVFRFDDRYQVLHEFRGADGAAPAAAIAIASDGYLYGTTEFGGRGNSGTIFALAPGGDLISLYHFSGRDGAFPRGGLTEAGDGWLYGTTASGGEFGRGTVFRLPLPPSEAIASPVPSPTESPTDRSAVLLPSLASSGVADVGPFDPDRPELEELE